MLEFCVDLLTVSIGKFKPQMILTDSVVTLPDNLITLFCNCSIWYFSHHKWSLALSDIELVSLYILPYFFSLKNFAYILSEKCLNKLVNL